MQVDLATLQAELAAVQRSIRNAEAAMIKGIREYPSGESIGLVLLTWYLLRNHLLEKIAQRSRQAQ